MTIIISFELPTGKACDSEDSKRVVGLCMYLEVRLHTV